MHHRALLLLVLILSGDLLLSGPLPSTTPVTSYAQQPVATSPPGALSGLSDSYLRNPRLGIAHISAAEGGTDPERYRLALSLGAGWNRWPLYWNQVEAAPGEYNWARYDRQVADDLRFGLKINAIFLGRPDFYAQGDRIQGINEPIFADGSDFPAAGKALNPANPWVKYVYAAVQRYKPGGTLAQQGTLPPDTGITVWEVWNEPDFRPFWSAGIREYARLLKISYIVIKQADPQAQVMVGGLTYATDDNWLARILALYVNDPQAADNNYYFDIVALHSYANPWRTGWLVLVARQTLIAYNLDRPIWVNETGVPVWDDYPGPTWASTADGRALRATVRQQAWFYVQSAVYGWSEGAEVVMFHQLYDDCGDQPAGSDFPPHNGELCVTGAICAGDAHGMFRNAASAICFSQHPQPATPRPAASAYRLLAQVFNEPFGKGRRITLREGVEVIAFTRTRTDETIYAFWNRTFTPITLELPAQGDNAQLISLDGSDLIAPSGGLYRVELPPALPDDYPNRPVGADAAIGGPPFVLIERPGGRVVPLALDIAIGSAAGTVSLVMPTAISTPRPPARPTLDPAQDTTPPRVTMNPLPVTSPPSFTVSWRGEDDSGIALYQVWVRIDGGAWQPWLETEATSAEYTGVAGRLYEFDVWARDLAGNWSTDVTLRPRAVTRVR